MSTIAEDLIAEFTARVRAALAATEATVRRDHLTPISREAAPMVDIVTGDDLPEQTRGGCFTTRRLAVNAEINVRSDQSYAAADPYLMAILAAVNPEALPYPQGGGLEFARVRRPRPEIADADALTVVMEFTFVYRVVPWTLDQATT